MVDGSVSGLVVTAVIDAIIFTIVVIVFFATRKARSAPPDAVAPEHSTVLSEHGKSFGGALKEVLAESHEKKIELIGKETWAYLQVHKIIAYVLVAYTIFGWAPLIGVYITGSTSVKQDVDQTSFAHVYGEDDLLAAPMVFLLVFSIIYSIGLVLMARHFIRNAVNQPEAERPISANILMADNLPNQLSTTDDSPELLQVLQKNINGIVDVYIIPNYAAAQRTALQIKEVSGILENLKERETKTGKQELIRPKCCAAKVSAIQFYTDKLAVLEQNKATELDKGRHTTSGQAFIEFETVEIAEEVLKVFHSLNWGEDKFSLQSWVLTYAPSLEELNWHNLDANKSKIRVTKTLYTILFVVLFIFVLTPAAVLAYIGTLASFLGEWLIGFIGEYLPTIIIILLHSVLLPLAINFLVKKEMLFTKSAEVLSATFKYFLFILFYVFIIPILGLQFIQIISDSVSGSSVDWANIFATRLVKSSRFFTILMIHAVFFGNGFDLAALGRIIMVTIKKKRAVTDTDRKQIYEADIFDIARNYALSVVYLIIAVTFSVSFPIISTLALLYFGLRFAVHSYNMFYLYRRSCFQDLWKTIIWYMWFALFFFHIFTGSLFILTESTPYIVLGIIFLVMGCCIFVAAIIFSYKVPKVFTVPVKLEGRNDKTLSDYEHPLEMGLKSVPTKDA